MNVLFGLPELPQDVLCLILKQVLEAENPIANIKLVCRSWNNLVSHKLVPQLLNAIEARGGAPFVPVPLALIQWTPHYFKPTCTLCKRCCMFLPCAVKMYYRLQRVYEEYSDEDDYEDSDEEELVPKEPRLIINMLFCFECFLMPNFEERLAEYENVIKLQIYGMQYNALRIMYGLGGLNYND